MNQPSQFLILATDLLNLLDKEGEYTVAIEEAETERKKIKQLIRQKISQVENAFK